MALRNAPKKKSLAERLAEAEADKKRLQAELAKREAEDDKKDDDERDSDEEDEKRDDDDAGGDEGGDERDGDEDDKKDDESDERDADEDNDKKDDKRSAPSRSAILKAERARASKITEMAERAGLAKLGRKHVDKGTSTRAFGEILLERLLAKQGDDKSAATVGVTGERSLGHEGKSQAATKEQRDMENGAAHWRKVAGKPAVRAA